MGLRLSQTLFVIMISTLAMNSEAKTLHVRMANAPISLDWTGQVTMADAPLVVNLCEGLFAHAYPSEKLMPAIAASLKKSKDLTEYTFQIRADAKWSDGRTIYAQDFVDAWQRLLSPQATSIYSYYLFEILNAREYNSKKITSFDEVGIHAVKDKTLVVKFKHPQPNWEATTAFWPLFPVRKDLIEKFGNNWWRAGTLVSSGPFILTSYEPGKKATLKKNPYYKKTLSNVDEIEINFVPDDEEAMKKYKEKYFSFLSGIPTENFQKDKEFRSIPLLRHHVFVLNTERFPFNNKFFRLAVLSAIDRTELISSKNPQLSLATALIPPVLSGSKENFSVPYDPKKAREYLEKSGIVLSKGFKINFLAGFIEPFYGVAKKIATQIESTLGIPVEIMAFKNQEFETFSNLGEYNALMISWTAKVRTPQDFLYPYSGYAISNRTHFSNEDYDSAIATNQLSEAQNIIEKENAAIHPLFFEKTGFLAHSTVRNIYFDHRGLPVLKDVNLK